MEQEEKEEEQGQRDGFHGDCSEMFVVGGEAAADPVAKRLLQTTYDCWVKDNERIVGI